MMTRRMAKAAPVIIYGSTAVLAIPPSQAGGPFGPKKRIIGGCLLIIRAACKLNSS
jgi:hypothetical protein